MTDRDLMEAMLKKITVIEKQQEENHAILKELKHNLSVNKTEPDTISHIECEPV